MTKVIHNGWGPGSGGGRQGIKRPSMGGDDVRQEKRNKVALRLEDK